jgi:hypothetical protein
MIEKTALTHTERGAKGGEARAEKLSTQQKKAIGKLAAEARWGADLPRATHDGPLHLADAMLMAAVLPNGKRLIVQGTMLMAIGRSRTPKAGTGATVNVDGLPFFLSAEILKPFITDELRLSTTPIFFRLKSGQRAVGFDAQLLPGVCRVYQRLRDTLLAELAKGESKEAEKARTVYARYKHIITRCDELSHGFSQRGILALVDDATGYQDDKMRQEIDRIIQTYVSPTLIPWVTAKFPPAFFREAYRLLGWKYEPGQTKHSSYMGKFINKYVFAGLPPGVLEELKARLPKNEKGNRRAKLWQQLTIETGIPHLDQQLTVDLALMQISDTKQQFHEHWDKLFGKQPKLPFSTTKELGA